MATVVESRSHCVIQPYPVRRTPLLAVVLVFFSDAYPLQQVDYFWKASDKQGIVILADEMNEYTLTDIKTKKGLVHYGTRSSSKSEFNLCAIVLLRLTSRIA